MSRRIVLSFCAALALTACAQSAGTVPSTPQAHRTISTRTVTANGSSYVVDEMYAPVAGQNLFGIAAGSDGAVWFTAVGNVGRSTTLGEMREFPVPASINYPTYMTAGPGGDVWFTYYAGKTSGIGRMSVGGVVKAAYPLATKALQSYPQLGPIAVGPDNDLWFVATASGHGFAVKMTPKGKMTAFKLPGSSSPQGIAAGSDGSMWLSDVVANTIERVSPKGVVKPFFVPTQQSGVRGVCEGPDGAIWFVESNASKIGRITTAGAFTEYPTPTSAAGPGDIVAGPDKALWFTEGGARQIGRMTTSGSFSELKLAASYASPFQIAVGPDKNIWFAETQASGVLGRVDLTEVKGSDPVYSSIALSLGNAKPQLGKAEQFPLDVTVKDFVGRAISGAYPNVVQLTSSDSKRVKLSATEVSSSRANVSVRYNGHYADVTIGAAAAGGGTVTGVRFKPTAPHEVALPSTGEGISYGPGPRVWMCLSNGSIATYDGTGAPNVHHVTNSFSSEGCSIVRAPDGNAWFTDYSADRIGRITPDWKVSFKQLAHDASPLSMTVGPDGALWFTEYFNRKIGRLTTNGQLTEFKAPNIPLFIVKGPDGNVWYSDPYAIYKVSMAGKIAKVRSQSGGRHLGVGPDKNIWFTTPDGLAKMDPAGKILATYPIPETCGPFEMTSGPEESLWFVSYNQCVGRVTTKGQFYYVSTFAQYGQSNAIAVGGGKVWFTELNNAGLGWLDPETI